METHEALTIMRKLASGVHPETGEAAPSDFIYRHPQAMRALHCAGTYTVTLTATSGTVTLSTPVTLIVTP